LCWPLRLRICSPADQRGLLCAIKENRQVFEPKVDPSIGLVEDPAQKYSGPIWARRGIRVEAADGTSYEVRNRVTLCRCGASKNKPYCDGQHAAVGFNDGL
jgi:hypothetical protein